MKLSANCGRWCAGLLILLGLAACASAPPPPAFDLDRGVIKGAHFKILVPGRWSGNVLVLAPGSRPRQGPATAELNPSEPFVASLLADGWLVATTGYRHHGRRFPEAVDDVQRLAGAIDRKYGPCRQILVEGSSLGANIGLAIAEQADEGAAITGIVAVGAALAAEPGSHPQAWTHVPRLPVLFVSNESEMGPVQAYVSATRPDRFQPAVWQLSRMGHVNINTAERLAAVEALSDWVDGGSQPAGTSRHPYDATVDLSDQPSRAQLTPEGLRGHITAVDPVYGNLDTDLVAADLASLQLGPHQNLRLVCGTVKRRAWVGASFSSAPEGKLVVYLNGSGFLRVAVNNGNAARRLKAHAGEPIEIRPWLEPVVPRPVMH